MVPVYNQFSNINYQKITWENLEDLTPDLINQLVEIDALFKNKPDFYKSLKENIPKRELKTIFYIISNGPVVLGAAIGRIKSVEDFNLTKTYKRTGSSREKMFYISEFFVSEKYQKKGIGTLLMSRILADQRVKYKTKFVFMYPIFNTVKVNKKITGNHPIVINTSKAANTESVLRNFEHSQFRYDLETKLVSEKDPNKSIEQYIHINKNPNYKKREIRSKAK